MPLLGKHIEFARWMTFAKVSSRTSLSVKRKIMQGRGQAAKSTATALNAVPRASFPPLPLFKPRRMAKAQDVRTFALTFLNRTRTFQIPMEWHLPELATGTRLWKLNLHYMEFLETLDDEVFLAVCEDWVRQNPPYLTGYWLDCWNSFALSIRVVVWMQQLAVRAGGIDPGRAELLCSSLVQQVRFLERNLETDIGGNHIVKNIKALIWASAFFQGDEARRWRRKGLTLLGKELGKQILPDGMHIERSASYHAQVFADLLECRHALGEGALGGALENAIHRMAQVVADLAHPDGGPALFNDAGLGMAYSPNDCLDVYERLFGRRPVTRKVFALSAAGYYGLRNGGIYLVADCGRIAPDDLPAHGHGDALAFELSVAGQRVFVDQGVFEYNAGEKRQRARSTLSHNTLCFEGADQADFFGAFRCGRRPNVTVLAYEQCGGGFVLEGTHDGFCHLPGKPRHVRRFEASPDRVLIRDRIEGTPNRPARIGFLLHPDAEATLAGTTATVRHGAGVIEMTCDAPMEIEPAVWWPCMGLERATSRLVMRLDPSVKSAVADIRAVQ